MVGGKLLIQVIHKTSKKRYSAMAFGEFREDSLLRFREEALLRYAGDSKDSENYIIGNLRRNLANRLKQRLANRLKQRANRQKVKSNNSNPRRNRTKISSSDNDRGQPQVDTGKLCQRPDGSTYGIPRNRNCVSGREISAPRQQSPQGTGVRPMTPEELRDERGANDGRNSGNNVRPPTPEELRGIRRRNLIPRLRTAAKNLLTKKEGNSHEGVIKQAEKEYSEQFSELDLLNLNRDSNGRLPPKDFAKAAEQMNFIRENLLSKGNRQEAREQVEKVRIKTGKDHYFAEEFYKRALEDLYVITKNKEDSIGSIGDPAFFMGGRAYAFKPPLIPKGFIAMSASNKDSTSQTSTLWHEFGHFVEYSNPEIYRSMVDFRDSRATSRKPESLNKLTDATFYSRTEVALPGNYISPYVGKVYTGKNATEVFSMGLQYFHSSTAMVNLYEKDPEYFKLIVGSLSRM